ncbi:MAG: B12-binding domain-containing radical SAM protein [Magnetococcales bacterium]|nr:B12-binding domain-containing radical SAM protein [Magnetococcales bacterium]
MALLPEKTDIILTTLNARYRHTAIGLRYLRANLAELREQSRIVEFDISNRPLDIAEKILIHQAKIIGISVYIWNVTLTTSLVKLIKKLSPDTVIVLGGPEVSHEYDEQEIVQLADYTVVGEGEVAFYQLCCDILKNRQPKNRIITPAPPSLDTLVMPYREYTKDDIAHRVIYVEASRGCPYRCEFCLSALDQKVREFPLSKFLEEMVYLLKRGVKHFKFMDRTFNLKIDSACKIFDLFLQHMDSDLFLHFEIVPDRLPLPIKQRIEQFPKDSVQFEIGVQSFNQEVLNRIGRKQDSHETYENLNWLRNVSQAHLHADLILGLPGESMASIEASFNQMLLADPHDIQVGILKRLRGTPIIRHTIPFNMVFNPEPPYDLLYSDQLDFFTMQRLRRFARYWDLIGNSGRFKSFRKILQQRPSPFVDFLALSDWLFATTNRTHKISLMKLFELIYIGSIEVMQIDKEMAVDMIKKDFAASGRGEPPPFI